MSDTSITDVATRWLEPSLPPSGVVLADFARALERELTAARAEVEECDRLRERMGELLTATAAALRGPPAAMTLHDWASIPDRAAAVVNALCGAMEYAIELRAEVEALRADAERYRWLRNSASIATVHLHTPDGWRHFGIGADEVVDAALAKEKP